MLIGSAENATHGTCDQICARSVAPPFAVPDKLQQMTDLTTAMVRQSLESFIQLDTKQARRVCRFDDEVDRYNREIINEVVELMRQSPEMIEGISWRGGWLQDCGTCCKGITGRVNLF